LLMVYSREAWAKRSMSPLKATRRVVPEGMARVRLERQDDGRNGVTLSAAQSNKLFKDTGL